MTHITNAIHRISHWLGVSLDELIAVADVLEDVQVTDRDIAEDLEYGRD